MWVIDEGLKPGEQVSAEGPQKLREGTLVTPKPYIIPGKETKLCQSFHQPSIVAMVIAILTVIVGAVTITSLPWRSSPTSFHRDQLQASYCRRGRADPGAIRRHAYRQQINGVDT